MDVLKKSTLPFKTTGSSFSFLGTEISISSWLISSFLIFSAGGVEVDVYKRQYQEIAEELNISIKTVENQMGKALKALRETAVRIYNFLLGLA